MKYPPPCLLSPSFWLYLRVAAIKERPHPHCVPSWDPQGCRAALEAGASFIGQKRQPKMLGSVWPFFPDVKLRWDHGSFVIARTGFWGCDLELSSRFGVRVCSWSWAFSWWENYFLPSFTALIPKDPADVKMSVAVKKKGEDAIRSTDTLSV